MPEGRADTGDIDQTPSTAVKRSTGEVRRLTLDDEERLRTLAELLMDQVGYTLAQYLADFKQLMEEILVQLRIANTQRAEMGNVSVTRNDLK